MAKKGKGTMLTDAQKKAKGLKLAEKHANTALAAIDRLTKTAGKYGEHFDKDTRDSIFPAFKSALEVCHSAFEGKATITAGIKLT